MKKNKAFIKKIREILLAQRSDLINTVPVASEVDSSGDEIDAIQAKLMIELEKNLATRNKLKLSQIESALKKIDANIYGVCEDCEDEIPEKRLEINPYFLNCVSCAEDRETEIIKRKKMP